MATKLLFKLFGLGLYLLTTSYYGFATDKGDYFAATETTQSLTINNVDFTKFSYSSIWRQRSKKANYVKEFKVSSQTQTDTWTIVDGKLYFNYNAKVKEIWLKQQTDLIEKADVNWPKLKDKP